MAMLQTHIRIVRPNRTRTETYNADLIEVNTDSKVNIIDSECPKCENGDAICFDGQEAVFKRPIYGVQSLTRYKGCR